MTKGRSWQGFSPTLRTQAHLLAKLRRDLARLEQDPADEDAAWDFFVTANHMRDWEKARGRAQRKADTPLLLLISELANQGKHFELSDPELDQVRSTAQRGTFQANAFGPAYFDTARLVVTHGEPAVDESALDIARRIVDFWAAELSPAGVP